MQRKNHQRRLGRVWLEHIVWNAAAAAVLALMLVVLLSALQWLDQVDPQALRPRAELEDRTALDLGAPQAIRPSQLARVNSPSG